jgi:hypothetical protein
VDANDEAGGHGSSRHDDWRPGDELTPREQAILADAAAGDPIDLGYEPHDQAEVRQRDPDNAIRASVLRHLLIQSEWPVHPQGVVLSRIRVDGDLHLAFATLRTSIIMESCYMDAIYLSLATASLISLTGCRLGRLTGGGLSAKGIDFSRTVFDGPLRLNGAKIGYLTCTSMKLLGYDKDKNAFVADRIKIEGAAALDQVVACHGAVRLAGAEIDGQLTCRGSEFKGRDTSDNALVADGMRVRRDVYLDEGFTADGAVRLSGADIGNLSFRDAQISRADKSGNAVLADGLRSSGALFFDDGFTAAGAIRLHSADVAVQLACRGARLMGRDGEGMALVADGARVGGSVYLDKGFAAAGIVSLKSARVSGSVGIMPNVTAKAEQAMSLDAAGAQIAGTLRWEPDMQFIGRVNLQDAVVGRLQDDWSLAKASANGYWPEGGLLCLRGFTYGCLVGEYQATVRQRLDWIRSQYASIPSGAVTGFSTQPYEQLATVYQEAGQDSDARRVSIARRADLRSFGTLSWHRRVGNLLLDRTIKYGYETWRAAVLLAVVYAIFLVLAIVAQHHNILMPTQDIRDSRPYPVATHCTSNYPCFYPAGYAIDTVIPIINVHQSEYWAPDANLPWGWAWVASTWIATGLGWAIATLLVAGYTGLVRRQ